MNDNNKTKVWATAIVLIITLVSTVVVTTGAGTHGGDSESSGILVDFGDYDGVWTPLDTSSTDPVSALKLACNMNHMVQPVFDADGKLLSVNGVASNPSHAWNLWVSEDGRTWSIYDGSPSDSVAFRNPYVSWARPYEGSQPLPCTDMVGNSIFLGKASKIVTMSPAITEMVCAIGCTDSVVGTDSYSNYPSVIADRREAGTVEDIGGYTSPSYETIISADPDLVIGDYDRTSQKDVADKLNASGRNAILLAPTESPDSALRNMWTIGQATGNAVQAEQPISKLSSEVSKLEAMTSSLTKVTAMVALDTSAASYAAGSQSYAHDIMCKVSGENIFAGEDTAWFASTAEAVSKLNPDVIIVISYDPVTTQSQYDAVMEAIKKDNPMWATTTAFKTGNIFMFSESSEDTMSRAGPRVTQCMELIAHALHPEAFESFMPRYMGDNYRDFLTVSGDW